MSFILVSLDGTTGNCDLEDYPANSNYPAALTYNNGEVLACGGLDLEDADRCWSFNGSAWSALPNSRQKHCKYDSTNVIVNEEWWITGRLRAEMVHVQVPVQAIFILVRTGNLALLSLEMNILGIPVLSTSIQRTLP